MAARWDIARIGMPTGASARTLAVTLTGQLDSDDGTRDGDQALSVEVTVFIHSHPDVSVATIRRAAFRALRERWPILMEAAAHA